MFQWFSISLVVALSHTNNVLVYKQLQTNNSTIQTNKNCQAVYTNIYYLRCEQLSSLFLCSKKNLKKNQRGEYTRWRNNITTVFSYISVFVDDYTHRGTRSERATILLRPKWVTVVCHCQVNSVHVVIIRKEVADSSFGPMTILLFDKRCLLLSCEGFLW